MSLIQVEKKIKKYYGLLTLLCVVLGFAFPQISILAPYVPVLLAILVFSMVIEHHISDFTKIVKHPLSVLSLASSNLVLYPVIGILFGYFVLSPQKDIYTGMILLCFAPSPVVAALWTEMSEGDGTVSITTALFSMMLSIVVYPVVLFFMGITSPTLSFQIFQLLALTIFAPAVIALFLRVEEERYIPAKKVMTLISSFVGLFIIVVAIANMSSKVFSNEVLLIFQLGIFVTILLIAGVGYGYLLSRLLKVQKKDKIAFLYTSSMRDGIIPLSVAITYFSSESTLTSTILLIIMPFLVVTVYYILQKDK
ncbi:MAG: hypothetical protein FJ150_05870 [Euryarchaeota archaeon]|nr:hypothetical protein [Euryarchaeota archaeon]